ncbi:hypothetical protein N8207_00640 [Planktomarina temperata]|nr:hypothetical protein [Planktomarina temperata]
MTIQQHASFDSSAAELNATSKLVKAWESKNAKNAAKAGGISLMALSLAACGGSDDTTTSGAGTGSGTDAGTDSGADAGTTPVEAVSGAPSVGFDQIVGTSGADTANFFVVQNSNGEQTNQFGTGDQINLAGGADVLKVVVQDASPLNAGPGASIAAYLSGVETTFFTALHSGSAGDAGGQTGQEVVEINAAFWVGTDVIGSVGSDASLTVYNVNTLSDGQAYGDDGALTSTMTIRMDHTANVNNVGGSYSASDLNIFFDEDYINPGSTSSSSQATFFILDQDGAQQDAMDTPLMHSVDADNKVDAAGTTTVFTDSVGVSFSLDGTVYTASLTDAQITAAIAAESYTHTDFVADLNANGGMPDGVTITVDAADVRTTYLDSGASYSVPAILVTSTNGGVFSDQAFVSREATGVEFNEYGRFDNVDPTLSGMTEINVDLLKVGRDGDGGSLIIGGMEDDGIQVFNVTVEGRANQPNSLEFLSSTNNKLEEVYVEADTGALASLEIGNGTLSGLTDVRVFDAASFDNGVGITAEVTDESVAKYMVRTDTAADPSADNADFAYSSGAGNDAMDIVISKANLEASGTANREDFSMSVATGDGNDEVVLQIGDGAGTATDAWYMNHGLMDANADSRIGVDAGAGNDSVTASGASIFRIDMGAGNDAGYTDNSSEKASWVLNEDNDGALRSNLLSDLRSDANDNYGLLGQKVAVAYKGYAVTSSAITDNNTTDLEINNIIKGLIQGDEHLSDLLEAVDGPGNTLVIHSLVDGVEADVFFNVGLVANTALANLSDQAIAAYNAANSIVDLTPTMAEVQTHIDAEVANFIAENDYNSELATTGGGDASISFEADAAVGGGGSGVTTITIGGATVTVAVADGLSVIDQGIAYAAAIDAIDGVSASASNAGLVTITSVTGEFLQDMTVITTATDGAPGTGLTFTAAAVTADTKATGANSIAENDNTITDGSGEDTIVLSTDATSDEQVVLVLDGEHDMIVNFSGVNSGGGDTINLGSHMTNATGVTSTVTNASAVAGAVVTGVLTDGGIVIDDDHSTNDTLAKIQALVTAEDTAVSAVATEGLYIVKDDFDETGSIYLVQDGLAIGDATVTLIDTMTVLGVDLGLLVAADIII